MRIAISNFFWPLTIYRTCGWPQCQFFSVKMFPTTGLKVCQCAQGVCASNGVCMDNSFLGLGGQSRVVVKSWSSRHKKIGAARTPGHQQELWCESEPAPTVPTVPTVPAISAVPAARLVKAQSDDVRCIFCFSCFIGGQQNSPLPFFGRLYKAIDRWFWILSHLLILLLFSVLVCNGMYLYLFNPFQSFSQDEFACLSCRHQTMWCRRRSVLGDAFFRAIVCRHCRSQILRSQTIVLKSHCVTLAGPFARFADIRCETALLARTLTTLAHSILCILLNLLIQGLRGVGRTGGFQAWFRCCPWGLSQTV